MSYSVSRVSLAVALLFAACGSNPPGGSTPGGTGGSGGGGTGAGSGGAPASTGGAPGANTGGAPAPGQGGQGGNGGAPGSAPGTGGSPSAGDAGPSPTPDTGSGTPDAAPSDLTARCRTMIDAATAFLKTIEGEPAKRSQAALAFTARRHFKYTPGDRPGLRIGDMTPAQRDSAFALVKAGLSTGGFEKAETIRGLELVLRAQEGSNSRDPLSYFVAVYGTPSADGDWGWHWEGHHLSLHYTLSKCTAVADAPAFFGSNPARVGMAVQGAPPMGTRALGAEEDLGRALAKLLAADAGKRAMAIATTGDREVPDSPAPQQMRPAPAGIAVPAMAPAEVEALRKLLAEYANTMPADLAAVRLKKIQDAGFDKVTFLWVGGLEAGQGHYYRVQGPTFLVEYLNQQGNANHVHSVWRDFAGDFGEDLLKLHLREPGHAGN